jgi:GT2 family glycosyltransferase
MYVVTLNWNLKDDTIACVESVLAARVALRQIVVVDNGSTDGSVRAFRTRFGPDLPVVVNETNLGFGSGMNRGIRYALSQGAASVLVLNNDTIVDAEMVDVLLQAGNTLQNPGILGPAIYYYDAPDKIWKLGDIRHRWLPMPLSVRIHARQASISSPFRVDYVTGCGMLIRREVLERIGLFDERYFMYFEDADFCRRARDAGSSVWCVPQARMWHKVSLTAQRDRATNRYHRALSQARFYHEHRHGPSGVLRDGYIVAKLIATLAVDGWHRDWQLIKPLLQGTLDGYREARNAARQG